MKELRHLPRPVCALTPSGPFFLAAGCLLLAACGSDKSAPAATPPASVNYAPSDGVVPLPTDLLFAGSTDLTLSIPGVDTNNTGNASAVEVALSAMDGWSTTAPMSIGFNSPLDGSTLIAGTTVRMFEVTLDTGVAPVGGPVSGITAELAGGTDFTVGIDPDIAAGDTMRIYPNVPLKPSTSYMWILTNGIMDASGRNMEKTGEYLLASATEPFTSGSIVQLQGLVNSHLVAASGAGIDRDDVVLSNVFTTQGVSTVFDTLGAVIAGQEAAVITNLCNNLPSGCIGEDTTVDPNNTSSLLVNTPSTITTMDRVLGSPGAADIYTGELTVPYYLTGADNNSPTGTVSDPGPATQPMKARFSFAPGDTTKHLTSFNPLPSTTGQETIPVLITIPNATSTQVKPAGGWPVVVFQHGVTVNRFVMLALADAYAFQGIAMVAIDLPLHGSTDSSDAVLFAGFNNDMGGARERVFGLDLVNNSTGAPGPDGAPDSSGTHYINLADLVVARGNLVQSVSDLMHLTAQLPSLDYDGGGADIDPARMHFLGHSWGGIMGVPFLRQSNANFQSATLAMAGSGIMELFDNSGAFGPQLQAGLSAANVFRGSSDYESYLYAAQTLADRADPANYAADLAASGLPIHFIEVVGGGPGGGLMDMTVPNSAPFAPLAGSEPLIALLGLDSIIADTTDAGGIHGVVRFVEGVHSSLISPIGSGAAFTEMGLQVVEFADSSGTALTLTDESVIDTTP